MRDEQKEVTLHLERSTEQGKVPEWSIGAVSKTVVPAWVPRVRIPAFPRSGWRCLASPPCFSFILSCNDFVGHLGLCYKWKNHYVWMQMVKMVPHPVPMKLYLCRVPLGMEGARWYGCRTLTCVCVANMDEMQRLWSEMGAR